MDSFAQRNGGKNRSTLPTSQSLDLSGRGRQARPASLPIFLRSPLTVAMGLAAALGWILPRLLLRQKRISQFNRHPERKAVAEKAVAVRHGRKKGPRIFSLRTDLALAVGLNLLKNHFKSWRSEVQAQRKDLTSENPLATISEPGAIDTPAEKEKVPRTKGLNGQAMWLLLKKTTIQWMEDKCPQLGAALAYFTVFSLAPLVLVLLAFFGLFFGSEHAREKIVEQLQYLVDPSGIKVVQDIAASASKPQSGILATALGIIVGLFGASGVFGQLQDALNTIWGVKAKPGAGLWVFFRARFLSFAMVAGVCFLLLVSLTVESVLRGLSSYLQNLLPGGHIVAIILFLFLDVGVVIVLFAMIFRFLPDIKIGWRDVWVGASLTAFLFVIGKFLLGLYLGSGAAGSAYGAASSLITLLIWIYYSAQILLFGAEFTQVYTHTYGSKVEPVDHAIRIKRVEAEIPSPRN